METKILLVYFAVGFVLVGWRLDLIEKAEEGSSQQKSGFSKFLAFCWMFLWILPFIPWIVKETIWIVNTALLVTIGGKVMTWREIIENANSEDQRWSSRARFFC
ncbi:MAG: hypothetical protein Q8L36_03855 [bacterium]|nr:hypothetical protein [bacterium]